MNKIKVNFFLIILLLILSACNTAKEAFTKKKNSGSEEFLELILEKIRNN